MFPLPHFDSQLQDALAGIQPRNDTNLNNLFWPVKGRDFQGDCPVKDARRSDELLPWVNDKQYKEIYLRLKAKHSFDLMSKQEFRLFIKHNVPAVRSVLSHVARWVYPSADADMSVRGRFGPPKRYFKAILSQKFFHEKNFEDSDTVAVNIIRMVVQIVFDYALEFSPKENPADDSYPTVDTTNPTTKKVTSTKVSDYVKRFRMKWRWYHLAKATATYPLSTSRAVHETFQ